MDIEPIPVIRTPIASEFSHGILPAQDKPVLKKNAFSETLLNLNSELNSANEAMKQVDMGKSDDVLGTIIAAQKADLNLSLLMQVRNKALDGFEQLLRMPV